MSQPLPKYATAARFERSTVDTAADRPILERSDLVLACADVLHTNGQSTQETVQAAERLGNQLGLRATMVHAGLIILAISVGLLLGMGIPSVSLPVGETGRAVPLWLDVIAAGVAVAAFSVFFSTPLRMLGWPVAIGMLAHAVRWGALKAGAGVATGALVACLLVGGILAPVARR